LAKKIEKILGKKKNKKFFVDFLLKNFSGRKLKKF